jgi:endonuclease/exonuclease/phosphatase family metal-dependent hydrolase
MDSVTLLTYNVRHAILDEGQHSWENRRAGVAERVRAADPDVLAIQESSGEQQAELAADLSDYDFVGVADEPGSGEHVPLGVRSPWEILDSEIRWLSESGEPRSVGWDAKYPRVVTMAEIRHQDGQHLTVCNTHFDHVGERARRESARLIRERVDAAPSDRPVVVLGDFNADPGSAPYETLTGPDFERELRDARTLATETQGPETTFTEFESVADGETIDHVFVTTGLDVSRFSVDPTQVDGEFPSDHLPVAVTLTA